MTNHQRAAILAAVSLCVTSLIGVSTPGFAAEMVAAAAASTPSVTSIETPNVSSAVEVPSTPTPEIPGVTVEKLPAESTADQSAGDTADDNAGDGAAEFADLSAAVAAQQAPASVDADLACLAGAIYFESKGEPLSGQLAVADVIINRSKSSRFPASICSVITQRGQFSFVRHGRIPHINTSRRSYRTALAVAQIALAKAWDNPAPKALFFHAKRVRPGWGLTKVASIGHHIFYR